MLPATSVACLVVLQVAQPRIAQVGRLQDQQLTAGRQSALYELIGLRKHPVAAMMPRQDIHILSLRLP